MFKFKYRIIITIFLCGFYILTAHATTVNGEHVNSIVYGKHYEKSFKEGGMSRESAGQFF